MTSAVISSRLVSLKTSWRALGRHPDGHVGDTGGAVSLAEQLDQLTVAGQRVGLAGGDQDGQLGPDADSACGSASRSASASS